MGTYSRLPLARGTVRDYSGSEFSCRKATLGDVEFLVQSSLVLACETEGRSLDTAAVRRGIDLILHSLLYVLIAEIPDGSPCGMLVQGGMEHSEFSGGVRLLVTSLYVTPPYRGLGIGQALYGQFRTHARSLQNVIGIRLCVDRRNRQAIRFYKRIGMQPTHYVVMDETWGPRD